MRWIAIALWMLAGASIPAFAQDSKAWLESQGLEAVDSKSFNEFEFAWEKHVSFRLPPPASPSLFLDCCDKTHWPIGYHNLYNAGQPDARHDGFLRDQGLAVE